MLMLPPSVRIYLATEPTDMRNAMDGLSAKVQRWGGDPFDGHLCVFLSKHRDRVKILTWSRGGFVLELQTRNMDVSETPDGGVGGSGGISAKSATPKRGCPHLDR